jgi:putative membrane protein
MDVIHFSSKGELASLKVHGACSFTVEVARLVVAQKPSQRGYFGTLRVSRLMRCFTSGRWGATTMKKEPTMRFISLFVLILCSSWSTLPAADTGTSVSGPAQDFVTQTAIFHETEITAAEMVMERNIANDLKNHARRIMRSHKELQRDLAALADDKKVTLTTTLPEETRIKIAQLKALADEELNLSYLLFSLTMHGEVLDYLEDVSAYNKDEDVRRYANKGIIEIRQHIQMARELEDKYINRK